MLARVKPTLILAPSPLDSHPDHRAAGLLTIAATAGAAPLARYWIVHGGEGWPSPRALLEGVPLTPAPLGARLEPRPFALTPTEEDEKLAALRAYHTQMRLMDTFLLSFVRTTELFSGTVRLRRSVRDPLPQGRRQLSSSRSSVPAIDSRQRSRRARSRQ